jgi:hypothetical protein
MNSTICDRSRHDGLGVYELSFSLGMIAVETSERAPLHLHGLRLRLHSPFSDCFVLSFLYFRYGTI